MSDPVVSNAEFLRAHCGDIRPDERLYITTFRVPPHLAGSREWHGFAVGADNLPELPEENNNYFATALVGLGGGRKKDNFRRQFVLTIDDVDLAALTLPPTYVIETSPGKHQVGYKLADSAQARDVEYMTTAINALARNGMVPKDKSGNNPVRYVRLPVGTNTKTTLAEPFRHVLKVWEPDRVSG